MARKHHKKVHHTKRGLAQDRRLESKEAWEVKRRSDKRKKAKRRLSRLS